MAGGVGCRIPEWELSGTCGEMFNVVVLPSTHLSPGLLVPQGVLSRWIPNTVCTQVDYPSSARFSRETVCQGGSAPCLGIPAAGSSVSSSRDGCLCVQVCRGFAFTCSSPGMLARGKASVCRKQGASAGNHGTVVDQALFSNPALSHHCRPQFSTCLPPAPWLGAAGDCPRNEALSRHLPPLFHPAFHSLSGCLVALINFGFSPRNSLSTHTNQEG